MVTLNTVTLARCSQSAGQTGADLLSCLSREPECSSAHPDVRFHPHPVLQRLGHVVQLESSKLPSSERCHCCSAHLLDHAEKQSDTWHDLLGDMPELSSIPSCLSTMCSRASSSPMNFTSSTSMVPENEQNTICSLLSWPTKHTKLTEALWFLIVWRWNPTRHRFISPAKLHTTTGKNLLTVVKDVQGGIDRSSLKTKQCATWQFPAPSLPSF